MTVLGIETATDVCSIGIVHGERTVERSLRESRIHSEMLLPLMKEVLDEASVSMSQVSAIALSSGPGSFTGLRIGASTAKGLLSAVPMPFILVPTFDGMRRAYRQDHPGADRFFVCLDAKQEEWYVQEFGRADSAGSIEIVGTSELLQRIRGKTVLTDLPAKLADHAAVHDVRQWCQGGSIAFLGRERLAAGRRDDVRTFEPTYWKEFVVRRTPKTAAPPREVKET